MQQFTGIAEKLVRAEENILNLYSEIDRFFEKCQYPVLPQNDSKALLEAVEYHQNLIIPVRFSVLAGEIIHHLRSCFDHIVWHFSISPVQNVRKIEFPIFDQLPSNREGRKLFEGKIAGITDSRVRVLIERLQPYNSPDPLDDPLGIIHNLDIVDKHKQLVLCIGAGVMVIPIAMEGVFESYKREHPELDAAQLARHFDSHGITLPSIAFRNFGRRDIQPINPGLTQLFNYTVRVVNEFRIL